MLLAGSTRSLRSVDQSEDWLQVLLGFSDLISQMTGSSCQRLQRVASGQSSSAPVLLATH